jgi:hypothetical protein
MQDNQQPTELKSQIKASIRRNSDRGFVNYSGCNRVCAEMMSIVEEAETNKDAVQAFDIYVMVLLEAVKLISHADTSSGAAGDVIHTCLNDIDKLCQNAARENDKHFFDTIIKAAKNKAFNNWSEDGYRLLKSAVYFVCSEKQAQKVYGVFSLLGTMYANKDYPDKLLITLGIIERLEGKEAADKYLMDHIEVTELRMIVVENALAAKHYPLAEKLCIEALKKSPRGYSNKPAPWAYYLERLYAETANEEKHTEMVRFILLHWDSSYFKKLKEIYLQQGIWELERAPLLETLSRAYLPHMYAILLAGEGEVQNLLDVIMKHQSYIIDHGKQLAVSFPVETYKIYEEYLLHEAKEATDRGKYRNVCKIIRNFYEAGAKSEAIEMIDQLSGMYQRRPAMIEELAGLKGKLSK